LQRYVAGLGASWEDAQDVAQEALLRAWRARASFDGRSNLRTWIFGIARNHYLDLARKRQTVERNRPEASRRLSGAGHDGPEAPAQRAELARALERALDTLPPEQREALAMRENSGLTFAQIADLLGVSPNTVKSRVRYALLKLAEELGEFKEG